MTLTEMRPSSAPPVPPGTDAETAAVVSALYTDGIAALKGAFSRDWAVAMREDIETAFAEARSRENGAVGRGPNRYYVEIHPEQLRGFVDLRRPPVGPLRRRGGAGPAVRDRRGRLRHPVRRRDEPALAPGLPDAGARPGRERSPDLAGLQPHAPSTPPTTWGRSRSRPGTQWDDGTSSTTACSRRSRMYPRYAERAVRKYPQRGDISVRSALTIHRGTENRSQLSRPVLVLGLDAPGAGNAEHHDLAVTHDYHDGPAAAGPGPPGAAPSSTT